MPANAAERSFPQGIIIQGTDLGSVVYRFPDGQIAFIVSPEMAERVHEG
jgi:hypothetical protein